MAGTPKSLSVVFLDGQEINKKTQTASTTKELREACASTLPGQVKMTRFLKYCDDFKEYVDSDDTDVVHMDKFQIHFISVQSGISDVIGTAANMSHTDFQQVPENSASDLDCEKVKNYLHQKDPRILAFYEEHGTLTEKLRRALVTSTVSYLVEKKGFYPVSTDKQILARTIVTLFPGLQIKMEEENEGYEHFYDPVSHSGFLEDKLRNIRRNLKDDQRRYRRRGGLSGGSSEVMVTLEEVTENEESVKEWITVIKRIKPTPENRSSIKMGMDKTYTHRRFWISSQSPTLAEIVENCPRFIDMPYLVSLLGNVITAFWDGLYTVHVVGKTNEFEMVNLKNIPNVLPLDLFTYCDSEKHIIIQYKLV